MKDSIALINRHNNLKLFHLSLVRQNISYKWHINMQFLGNSKSFFLITYLTSLLQVFESMKLVVYMVKDYMENELVNLL